MKENQFHKSDDYGQMGWSMASNSWEVGWPLVVVWFINHLGLQSLTMYRRKVRSPTSDSMDRWKAEVGRVREQKRREEEDQRRERVRRKKMQVRKKVGKSRNILFVAPEGRKEGLLKQRVRSHLATREMKLYTAEARSTCGNQNAPGNSASDHFWNFRCWKRARSCGAKHVSKSKCQRYPMLGPFLEVQMLLRGKRQGFCTLFCWSLPHSITLDYTTAAITSIITATASPYANCITPQRFNTLLYIPLRHTSVNYITHEHCIAVFTVHYTTWNTYTSLQSATLRYITATATTTLLYRTLRYLALQHTALITVQHLRVKLHYATTTTTALLHHTASSTCGWADRQVTIEMIEKHISNHLATENWFAICESQRLGSPVGIS